MTRHLIGYTDNSIEVVYFVKKCLDLTAVDPNLSRPSPSTKACSPIEDSSYKIYILCIVGASYGTFIGLIPTQFGVGIFIYKRRKSIWMKAISALKNSNSKGLAVFMLAEINEIT
ncbi:hypothetical protein SAY86_017446 [Trapa natans]|uniref:Uncharacterized protein n=1 Tax=Trapa natans TaxID=22666 RepID=A0AAN7R536_TRANT|nr:hypothetical protein SAY86_017446 [Trapa natans]